jgi:hypothetical protein
MVVVTRSRSRSSSGSSSGGSRDYIHRRADADANSGSRHSTGNRSVKILTPSFREASVRSYKIYNGSNLKSTYSHSDVHHTPSTPQEEIFEAHAADAAETLTELKTMNKYSCMNPMHPITRYMYRMQVYNSSRTHHYRTAFIGYNNKTRLFYIHTIISNCYRDSNDADTDTDAEVAATGLPRPVNTIQTKYSSYINETIENYIMTMMVPSREYDYYIQDDIIGVVTTEAEFCDVVFGQDSSYYDVERLLHDESSNETINGFKAFSLIPSRNFWFDPLVAETHSSAYSSYTIHSVLSILSQSQ